MLFKLFYRLTDAIGERLYNRNYKRRYTVDLAETRAANARYFDVDEDHCQCPGTCEVHG